MHENQNALLFLHAMTPLHPGTGTALGTVDLPVQRERHTDWPLIPGSSLKGILRDAFRAKTARDKNLKSLEEADRDETVKKIFGRPVKDTGAPDQSGALSVTDARLLLFPVRSLRGLFALVTCPAALQRFERDAGIGGIAIEGFEKIPKVTEDNDALVSESSPLLIPNENQSNMVLEEFDFTAKPDHTTSSIAIWLSGKFDIPRLVDHLAIISDDNFAYYVKHATEVSARIALDYDTKTAEGGALFYEESIPTESVFYSLLLMNSNQNLLCKLEEMFNALKFLQIGGNSTIGKGICRAILLKGGDTK